MEEKERKNQKIGWMRDLLCGALLGMGAILPGVSGGVLAVVFDLYRPFMEVLTRPRMAIPLYWRRFPPLGIGWCVGFWGFAKGITAALQVSEAVPIWLFIGLIVGTFPALLREAGQAGRSTASWVSMAVCALSVFAGLFYLSRIACITVTPNFWWYTFCGALLGLGIVIPGLTASSIMMALHLYQPMMEGLSGLDAYVLLSCVPGMVLTILLMARLTTWFFRRHYSVAFHGIVGIVASSTLVILPTRYQSAGEALLSAVCCVSGFLLAFFLARLDHKLQQNMES